MMDRRVNPNMKAWVEMEEAHGKARMGGREETQTGRQTYRFAGTGIQTQERDLDMVMDSRTRKDLTRDRSGSTA